MVYLILTRGLFTGEIVPVIRKKTCQLASLFHQPNSINLRNQIQATHLLYKEKEKLVTGSIYTPYIVTVVR